MEHAQFNPNAQGPNACLFIHLQLVHRCHFIKKTKQCICLYMFKCLTSIFQI